MIPGMYTATQHATRDTRIAVRVLCGASYARVGAAWGISKERVRQVVLRWCARQAPAVYAQLGRIGARPSLTSLRAHRGDFGVKEESGA